MYQFTIIIPVYNEVENLPRVEQALVAYLQLASLKTSILFVDDGSTDGSSDLIRTICGRRKDFQYISFPTNQGLSTALKAGFDKANTSLVGYIDSDLQTDPRDFERLLKAMEGHDMAVGIRSRRADGKVKYVSSRIANAIRRLFTQDGIRDTGCPLKIIKKEYAQKIVTFRGMHRFLPALVLLQGGTVVQLPVKHFPRKAGRSKFGIGNRLLSPLIDCFVFLWMRKRYIRYEIKEQDQEAPPHLKPMR